jgi:hypothetical protein
MENQVNYRIVDEIEPLRSCLRCAAVVPDRDVEVHDRWHAELAAALERLADDVNALWRGEPPV